MASVAPPDAPAEPSERRQQWAGAACLVPGIFLVVNGLLFWAGSCLRLNRSTEACFVAPSPGFAGTVLGLGVLFLVLAIALLSRPSHPSGREGSAVEDQVRSRERRPTRPASDPRGLMVATAVVVALVVIVAYLFLPFVALPWLAPHRTTCACPPLILALSDVNSSHPAAGVYYAEIAISPYPNLTTSWFGVEVTNFSGAAVLPGGAPSSCAPPFVSSYTPFAVATCGAPLGTWYAVLVASNDTVANVFDVGDVWLGEAVAVNSSTDLCVVSGTDYTEPPAIVSVYGLDGHELAGSVYL